jgi:RHS repeat-associated protein
MIAKVGIGRTVLIMILIGTLTFVLGAHQGYGHKADEEDDTGGTSGGPSWNTYVDYEGGNGPGRCSDQGMPNYWVSTTTRELFVQDTDYAYKGLGPKISLTRSYNQPRTPTISVFGMFGDRWIFTYESWVDQRAQSSSNSADRGVAIKKGSGQRIGFYIDLSKAPPQQGAPGHAVYDRLTWYGAYFIFEEKETRLTYRYDQVPGMTYSRLTSISDPDGNEVLVNYNADGTIQEIVDAAGGATAFHYDANKHCTSMTIPDGRTATYQYDGSGNLIRTVDLNGAETVYTYDSQHHMTGFTAGGKTTTFTYEPYPYGGWLQIASVTDARGNVTNYASYSGLRVTDPENYVKAYNWNMADGYTTIEGVYMDKEMKTAIVAFREYTNALPSKFTDANGKTWNMRYDTRGNRTEVTDPLGNKTLYAYDLNDNLIRVTNALNETWNYDYDGQHHLIRTTSPLGNKTNMTYNELGQLTGITNANQKSTSFTYDDLGNLETITDPLGHQKRTTYGPDGLVKASIVDERNNETRFQYDDNDRVVSVTYADGTSKSYGYDCCAALSFTDENGNKTTFTRDPLLHITQKKDGMGNTTGYDYDKNGRLIFMADALGKTTTKTYDAAGRMTGFTDPKGNSIQMGYNANGIMTSLRDKRGKVTSFSYNSTDVLLSINNPLGQTTAFTRDALGRVITITNGRGQTIGLTQDKDGRIIRKSHGGTTWADYGYDFVGNLTSATDSTGKTAYTYNDLNEVTQITFPDGKNVAFSYDPAGNVSSITYPGGLTVQYTYDKRNRASSAAWGGNSVTYTYDGVGNVIREVRSNGTESTSIYDTNNRITEIRHKKGSNTFGQMNYTRDATGKITSETMTLPLTPVVTARSISASYNDANQVINWGAGNHTYDADGNLTSVGGGSFSAVYDPENRLSEINQNGHKTTYTYDGLGNRTRTVSGDQSRRFYYDLQGRLLFEANQSGPIVSYYIYRNYILAALGSSEGGFHFYHFDKTGNTIALTDVNGSISAAYTYEPFGEVSNSSGAIHNPFTYSGALGVMEEEDGIFFMKNRYYDSRRGRFLQKDPIGIAGGLNLYAYAGNNPIDRVDPEGLFETIFDVIGRQVNGDPEAAKQIYEWDRTRKEMEQGTYVPQVNPKARYYVDKIISYIPLYGNIWGLAKSGKAVLEGKYVEAIKEGLGALPGSRGFITQLGTDIGEAFLIHSSAQWPDFDYEFYNRGGGCSW